MLQESEPASTSRRRRSEAELRNEHLDRGALLLRFHFAATQRGPDLTVWRAIEKKGFLVTRQGCLVPHQVHWFATRARHEAAKIVSRLVDVHHGQTIRDSYQQQAERLGWPSDVQLSHLCHDSNCCNPQHLVREPQWANLKRNYCGVRGACDCGMEPKCVLPYSRVHDYSDCLRYDTRDLGATVRSLFPWATEVEVLNRTFYVVEDGKRANRLLRRKRQKRHERQSKRKARRSSCLPSS